MILAYSLHAEFISASLHLIRSLKQVQDDKSISTEHFVNQWNFINVEKIHKSFFKLPADYACVPDLLHGISDFVRIYNAAYRYRP